MKDDLSRVVFRTFFVILIAISSGCACNLTVNSPSGGLFLEYADFTVSHSPLQRKLTGAEIAARLKIQTVEIDDPVYEKRKRYAAYRLHDVLSLTGVQSRPDEVWVFSALDGYAARIRVADALASGAEPFIAVRDLDAPGGWELIPQGKEMVSPGPLYLIWKPKNGAPTHTKAKLPWPYQLSALDIRDANEAERRLFPNGANANDAIKRGYETLTQNCLACHSLNLEGGVLGPELNVPRNITEYRDRATLKAFITDPNTFRARSKMPAFGDSLSSQAIDEVLDYLEWMGRHKVPAK